MPIASPRRLRRRSLLCAAAASLLALAASLAAAGAAAGADQPIAARVLRLERTADGAASRLVFATHDPALPFPAVGSADDPAAPPDGMTVTVFTSGQGSHSATAQPGLGNPGWRVRTVGADAYFFRTPSAPPLAIRKVTWVEGKRLLVRAVLDLVLAAPLGPVAVRVTAGSLQACAVFDGASIRRDVPGRFVAKHAAAPALPDCSDAALQAAVGGGCAAAEIGVCDVACPDGGVCTPMVIGGSCRCVYPTQPCGTTAPLCNGECPSGEQCYAIDGPLPGSSDGCACAPIDEPPCGAAGQSCGTGSCPAGSECGYLPRPPLGIAEDWCGCVDASVPCGDQRGLCPPELQCLAWNGAFRCLPRECGGAYPACGGACPDGRICVPIEVDGDPFCGCATPGLACDAPACGEGLVCPTGETCTIARPESGPATCTCTPS